MPTVAIDTTADIATLVAAPATGFIRITGYALTADGVALVRLKDGDGNVLTGLASPASGSAVSETYERDGQIDLPVGKSLQLTTSGAARVLGHVTYCNPGKTLV